MSSNGGCGVLMDRCTHRNCSKKEMTADRGRAAFEDFVALPITRYGHGSLVARIWALRHNMTAYDAAYVALAEALEAPLITRDRRRGTAPSHTALIEVV
jgi:predicted nucleic acid-binding protein